MYALVNPECPSTIISNIKKHGFTPLRVPLCQYVERPLAGHPDIQLCILKNYIIYHPNMSLPFIDTLQQTLPHYTLIPGQSVLQKHYPYDCHYNLAYTGHIAFHNRKITDVTIQSVLSQLHGRSDLIVHVKQAYTKCSVCIVDTHAIITADTRIHKAALQHNIDSLLITPGYICLPGYKYGFIGGASGLFNDTVYFTGKLHHPDTQRIEHFIQSHGKKIVYLSDLPAIDVGTIFFVG